MATKRTRKKYWTIERSFEEAKLYQYRSDFKRGSNRAYTVLQKNGLLNEACKHMSKKDTIRIWNKEACIEAAKKCKTKSEFGERFNGAYAIAKRRGWFNELLQYFTPVGSKYKRCIYVCEFPDNHAYVGLTFNLEQRQKQHLKNNDSAVYQYIKETDLTPTFKQVTDYIDYGDAALKEGEVLNDYKNNGWIMLNRCPTGGLGSSDGEIIRKWTREKCFEAAKTCSSYAEFHEKYGGAVNYAQKHNFIYEIKETMGFVIKTGTRSKKNNTPHEKTNGVVPNTQKRYKNHEKWSKDTALEESKKYETLSEFQEQASGAYMYILRNGLQKEMREGKKILQRDKWTFEEAKSEALKYKTKKEFRKNANGCYQICDKYGWMDAVTEHMIPYNPQKYNEEMAPEMLCNFSNMEQLKKNVDQKIRGFYWWMKSNKKLKEYKIYLKGDPLNTKKVDWTNELILDDIKKYKTYTEYRSNGRSYQYSRLHNLLESIKKFYKNEEIWF